MRLKTHTIRIALHKAKHTTRHERKHLSIKIPIGRISLYRNSWITFYFLKFLIKLKINTLFCIADTIMSKNVIAINK